MTLYDPIDLYINLPVNVDFSPQIDFPLLTFILLSLSMSNSPEVTQPPCNLPVNDDSPEMPHPELLDPVDFHCTLQVNLDFITTALNYTLTHLIPL